MSLTHSDYLSWIFLQLAMAWCPQLINFNSIKIKMNWYQVVAAHILVLEFTSLLYWEAFEVVALSQMIYRALLFLMKLKACCRTWKSQKMPSDLPLMRTLCVEKKNLPHHPPGWKCLRIPVFAQKPTSFRNYKSEIRSGTSDILQWTVQSENAKCQNQSHIRLSCDRIYYYFGCKDKGWVDRVMSFVF